MSLVSLTTRTRTCNSCNFDSCNYSTTDKSSNTSIHCNTQLSPRSQSSSSTQSSTSNAGNTKLNIVIIAIALITSFFLHPDCVYDYDFQYDYGHSSYDSQQSHCSTNRSTQGSSAFHQNQINSDKINMNMNMNMNMCSSSSNGNGNRRSLPWLQPPWQQSILHHEQQQQQQPNTYNHCCTHINTHPSTHQSDHRHQNEHQNEHHNHPTTNIQTTHKLNYNMSQSTEQNYKSQNKTLFVGQYSHIRASLDYTYHSNYIPSRQLLQDNIVNYLLFHHDPNSHHTDITSTTTTTATAAQGEDRSTYTFSIHEVYRNPYTSSSDIRYDNSSGGVTNEIENTNTTTNRIGTNKTSTNADTNTNTNTNTATTNPWIVFTAGAMGAGKGYTIKHLHRKNRFPLSNFTIIDPDEIRRLLPEFDVYTNSIEPSLAEHAGTFTKKEAGYIAELFLHVALQQQSDNDCGTTGTGTGTGTGKNVLIDGSLKDYKWYNTHFDTLKQRYQHLNLKIAILHIIAPREAVFKNAKIRSKMTKRIVPQYTLEESLEQVPKSVKILSPKVDFFAELYNAPYANDIELITEGMDWNMFKQVWGYDNMDRGIDMDMDMNMSTLKKEKGGSSTSKLSTCNNRRSETNNSQQMTSSSSFRHPTVEDHHLLKLLSKL